MGLGRYVEKKWKDDLVEAAAEPAWVGTDNSCSGEDDQAPQEDE
jgi:hypothetical protein